MWVRAVVLVLLATVTRAWADVPDASLRAIGERVVRIERDDGPAVEGRVLAFEAGTVTVAATGTNEVITIPREHVARVVIVAVAPIAVPVRPEKRRMWSAQFGIPGTLAVDVDHGRLHGFASFNVLASILTAESSTHVVSGAIGGGLAVPMSSRWKLDVFGAVIPLHVTSFYTYLGAGIGAGFHYTARSGITVGFTLPVLGFARRIGSSPYGYDARFRYSDSLGYYYFAGALGLPLVTMGYRFACPCKY